MNAAVVTTFEVSDVRRASEALPEVPYKRAVETLLRSGITEEQLRRLDRWGMLDMGLPADLADRSVEACSRYHGRLLDRITFHPVVAAVHRAFKDHRPLRLSPDMIWLMICQAVANHVNADAERLRPRLVRHEGKVEIKVYRDDFVKGSPENPWPEVFGEFSEQVRGHVGPTIDLFLPAFSTTGPAERAAAEIVLMEAVRVYFDYTLITRCGIPENTLEGTPEDWRCLADRAEAFAEFGLERWTELLRPILGQFVRASQGEVDTPFWRSLYRLHDQSGGPVITGWIMAFFAYLKDHRTGQSTAPIEDFFGGGGRPVGELLHPGEEARRGFVQGPSVADLPGGLSVAPFRWEYLGTPFAMELLVGFVGVSQDEGTLALRPEIGWAVRETGATP